MPALKDGKYIHKNRVPIIAKVFDILLDLGYLIILPYSVLPMKKLTINP